jgi:hypothetical protein
MHATKIHFFFRYVVVVSHDLIRKTRTAINSDMNFVQDTRAHRYDAVPTPTKDGGMEAQPLPSPPSSPTICHGGCTYSVGQQCSLMSHVDA